MSKEEYIESINRKEDNGDDKIESTFPSSNEGASMDIGNHKKGNKNTFLNSLSMETLKFLIEFS